MGIKIGEIVNARPVFEKLVKFELPFHTVRALGKMVRAVSEELVLVEEKRVALVRKYGVEDEQKNITVAPDKMEAFKFELEEIMSTEIDFSSFITTTHLENENVKLSTSEYYLIEKFIVESV
jgi:hypothetical protein